MQGRHSTQRAQRAGERAEEDVGAGARAGNKRVRGGAEAARALSKSALDAPLFGRDLATFDVLAPCSRSTWQPGHSRRLGEQGGAGQRCVHFSPFSLFPFHLQSLSPWSSCARWTTGYSDTLCLLSPCISFSKFLQNRAALLPPPFRQASLTSTGPSLSSTSASPSFTNRHQSSRRNGKPGVARIRSLRLPHGHRL